MDKIRAASSHIFDYKMLLFLAFFIYVGAGILPFSPIEGDGAGIANGATQLLTDFSIPPTLGYRFALQPGTYIWVVEFSRLTGLSTFTTFSLLSGISALIAILLAASVAASLAGVRFATAGLIILLFQEAYSSGYYANSTTIASAFLFLAMVLFQKETSVWRQILAGIAIGIAVWTRIDSVILAPVVVFLALPHEVPLSYWKIFRRIATTAVVAIAVSLSLLYWSRVPLEAVLFLFQQHHGNFSEGGTPGMGGILSYLSGDDMKSHIAFYSVLTIYLTGRGIWILIQRQQWRVLAVLVIAIVPFYAVLGGTITSPKYLYYLLPVLVAVAVIGAVTATRRADGSIRLSPIHLAICSVLFVTQYLFGLNAEIQNKEYWGKPEPQFVEIFSSPITGIAQIKHLSFSMGSGLLIPTADGTRLSGGIAYAPLTWRGEKQKASQAFTQLTEMMKQLKAGDTTLVAREYQASQYAKTALLEAGYTIVSTPDRSVSPGFGEFVFESESRKVTVQRPYLNQYMGRNYSSIVNYFAKAKNENSFFIATTEWEKSLLKGAADDWNSSSGYIFVPTKKLLDQFESPVHSPLLP